MRTITRRPAPRDVMPRSASKTPFDVIMTGMRMSDVSSSAGDDIVGSEMLQSASTQPFAPQRHLLLPMSSPTAPRRCALRAFSVKWHAPRSTITKYDPCTGQNSGLLGHALPAVSAAGVSPSHSVELFGTSTFSVMDDEKRGRPTSRRCARLSPC